MIWLWILLWVVLVIGGAAILVMLGLRVFRKGVAAMRELGVAQQRLDALNSELVRLQLQAEPAEPAIFADRAALRAERQRAVRRERRLSRRRKAH